MTQGPQAASGHWWVLVEQRSVGLDLPSNDHDSATQRAINDVKEIRGTTSRANARPPAPPPPGPANVFA